MGSGDAGGGEADRTGGVGSKYHAVAEFRGKRQPIDYVVTELGADRIVLRGENKTVISVDTISVAGRVRLRGQLPGRVHPEGAAKLAKPFVRPMFEKLGDPAADGMRKRLDSRTRHGRLDLIKSRCPIAG